MSEILDLVNENDEVVGQMERDLVYAKHLSNLRVINAFLVSDEGKIWVPKRAASKRVFPLGLDMSVGGHVETGEDYDVTFARETMEELNIDTQKLPWRLLGKLNPHEHHTSAFMQVYEIRSNETPNYNTGDFVGYEWLSPEEILEKKKAGVYMKDDLPRLVRIFYPPTA
ncbi:MAG: NUDIX hydrolase [Candidatus Lloydbacteria bacterium RIFCSPHIGHO2_02_FULL_54_17]|uniref:NUDIX hydrolase n=1 Tax=Candidatus Lloydbacteria bacterium RIFCSPHIGHO2_02_FULL_54_17 TaxID=1798664 RepID=A0A1G2DG78_9BACT|nr:MAG: NUDIX hydrolase [Candidatus Lloydbacteria bacterium RIFCSPHIGHO2_02_FULL_54_17]OGZ14701.1 MAG: NUDIX hydrolase [Candidatus Lloydbacteria bacterium RIFCSPLOWO2_01_FULL_54_18]OGZ16729.1 MAG: NUDIX hydrolase [Candidatus Lloydbacteria bacterium RIFCSPLOWO2_02_FULL_54_12]